MHRGGRSGTEHDAAHHGMMLSVVASIVRESAAKQCELDPLPTWLVKRASVVLAPVIVRIYATHQTKLPSRSKMAIVRPLLKKRTLDLNDPASYRPISNLSSDSLIMSPNIIYFQSSSRLTAHFIQPKQHLPASITT